MTCAPLPVFTYPHPERIRARTAHIARLRELSNRPALGRLLDMLVPYGESLPPDSDDARLLGVTRREFEKARKVPPRHVQRVNAIGAASYDVWTKARPANDFTAMRPYLEQMIDLSREYASFFGPYSHIADPLIDDVDEGRATLERILARGAPGIRFNEHLDEEDGPLVFHHACKLGLEGIVSKRRDLVYSSGRSPHWIKSKNPEAPAVRREFEEDWSVRRRL